MNRFLTLAGIAAMACMTTSCEDDWDYYTDSKVLAGALNIQRYDAPDDYRLSYVRTSDGSKFEYEYDNEGYLTAFLYDRANILESLEPFELYDKVSDHVRYTETRYSIRFNARGTINRVRMTKYYEENGVTDDGEKSVEIKFSYNGKEQMRWYTMNVTDRWSEGWTRNSYRSYSRCDIHYEGRSIVASEIRSSGSTIENGNYATTEYYQEADYNLRSGFSNYYYQYTPNVLANLEFADPVLEQLAFLGYFGLSSEILPSSITWRSVETVGEVANEKMGADECYYKCFKDAPENIYYADGYSMEYATIGGNKTLKAESDTATVTRRKAHNLWDTPSGY